MFLRFKKGENMIETSVLILHYNKNYEIELLLEAFLQQTVDKNSFEIVIADDGSEKSIRNTVEEYTKHGLHINLLELKHTGNRALNRSKALHNSCGKNIIFYDADMIPCRTFIERHEKNLQKGEKIVSLGYRFLLNDFSHDLITPKTISEDFGIIESMPCELDDRIQMIHAHNLNKLSLQDGWYMVYSHNIALRKALYQEVQGFDENFNNGWGAEDIEFGFQLYKAGAHFIYDEEIKSYHIYHDTGSTKIEQYKKNLNYFYSKYKSFEPELFMLEYKMDSMSFYKLYSQVIRGKHLGLIDKEVVKQENRCLFIGFKETGEEITKNENVLISTKDYNSKYKLVGSCLPFNKETQNFEKAIISSSYSIFNDDYLYLIIKEVMNYVHSVYIWEEKLIKINDFWKNRTGYTFDEFEKLEKLRVVITPSSSNRYDNVLYSELLNALNENGYYASLEICNDSFKDQRFVFPLNTYKKNNLIKYYHRNLEIISDDIVSFIEGIPDEGEISKKNIWWGDIEYYNQDEQSDSKGECRNNKYILRNISNSILKPGIRSTEINKEILDVCIKRDGVILTDLYIENIEQIENILNIVAKQRMEGNTQTVTIIVLSTILDVYKVNKNLRYYVPEIMCERALNWYKTEQLEYIRRFKRLTDLVASIENVFIYQTNGSLEEINEIIKENQFYIDINSKKTFNPYVLQAAAYGLQVLTGSDIYDSYGYPNICKINSISINAIYDLDDVFDSNWKIKSEMKYQKHMIDIESAFEYIKNNMEKQIDISSIIKINNKNSCKQCLNKKIFKQFLESIKNEK